MNKINPTHGINRVLQSRQEVDEYTNAITTNGLMPHPFSCKNFDIMAVVPRLQDGDILDMGSSGGSCILENAIKIGVVGRKVGIDLEYAADSVSAEGIEYVKGDLMNTPFKDNSFQTLCCLSVLEHEVSYDGIAKESARLLKQGGQLFITCDYFDPKVDTSDVGTKLYGLKWNILDRSEAEELISALSKYGLELSSPMDWTTNEKVINPQFFAPYGKEYSFASLQFIKN